MLQRFNTLGRRLSAAFTEDDLISIVGNAPLIKVGNTWRAEKLPNITTGVFIPGIANLGSAALYNTTAGTFPVVYQIDIGASNAGRFQLLYNAVTFKELELAVKASISIELPRGLVFPTTGGQFAVINLSGAASDVAFSMVLSEYTP